MAMPKILMCLAILACAATVQSKPTSDIEKASCVGCNPVEILHRSKRCLEDIIEFVGNVLYGHSSHRLSPSSRNFFIGNGQNNYNKVTIHSNPDDNYYYDDAWIRSYGIKPAT